MPPRTYATLKCPHCEHETTSKHMRRHLRSLHPEAIAAEAIAEEPAAPQGLNCK